jgi:hypothetical protein
LGAAIVQRVEKKQGKEKKPKETGSTRNKAINHLTPHGTKPEAYENSTANAKNSRIKL